jgi:hypothetical protein
MQMLGGTFAGRLCGVFRTALLALAVITSAPVQAKDTGRIVAVGDLHGDYSAWVDVARDARLIDAKGNWIGGSTTLVQLGDITDRGSDSLKIIRSLQLLAKEAPRSHGKVIVVLGNHEAMNLLGDLRYTTPGEFSAFADAQSPGRREAVYQANKAALEAQYRARNPALTPTAIHDAWIAATPLGWVEHRLAWKPSGELGQWATKNPAIAKIGGTLFVHGGISAEYAAIPLEQVNLKIRKAMTAADETTLNDPLGPLWYRGLILKDTEADAARKAANRLPPATVEEELTKVLTAYGAKRIVVGHTPSPQGIQITNNGELARIDTGMSRVYGGPLTWLEIVGDKMTPHNVRRTAP